jgi:ribosomal protein L16 Arg81 hydroxylase
MNDEMWCIFCKGLGYITVNWKVKDISVVCPTCRGKGTLALKKGEKQMSDETVIPATVTSFTPLDAIQKEIDNLKEQLNAEEVRSRGYREELSKLRNTVHEFFSTEFDSDADEVTITRDEANELLGDIGADLLQQEFEGRVTISYSFTVKAESQEEAEEKVKNAVGSLEYSIDSDADDEYSEESIEVEF